MITTLNAIAPIFLIKESGSMGSLFLWLNFVTWPRFQQMRSSFTVRNQDEFFHSWEGTELVHFHGLWQPNHLAAYRECKRRRLPYLISPHGMLEPWAYRSKLWKKWPKDSSS